MYVLKRYYDVRNYRAWGEGYRIMKHSLGTKKEENKTKKNQVKLSFE